MSHRDLRVFSQVFGLTRSRIALAFQLTKCNGKQASISRSAVNNFNWDCIAPLSLSLSLSLFLLSRLFRCSWLVHSRRVSVKTYAVHSMQCIHPRQRLWSRHMCASSGYTWSMRANRMMNTWNIWVDAAAASGKASILPFNPRARIVANPAKLLLFTSPVCPDISLSQMCHTTRDFLFSSSSSATVPLEVRKNRRV